MVGYPYGCPLGQGSKDLNQSKCNLPVGSDPSAASGEYSEVSEWQRSKKSSIEDTQTFFGHRNREVACRQLDGGNTMIFIEGENVIKSCLAGNIYSVEYSQSKPPANDMLPP